MQRKVGNLVTMMCHSPVGVRPAQSFLAFFATSLSNDSVLWRLDDRVVTFFFPPLRFEE